MILKDKFILLVLLGSFLPESTDAQWMTHKVTTTSNLNAIDIYSEKHGWIVGDQGSMLYLSKDVWVKNKNVTSENLYSVCLTGENDGWAVGSHGTILHLKGKRWVNYPSPTKEKLNSVSFMDAEHGVAVGERGIVIIYENGIWRLTQKTTIGNLYTVALKYDLSLVGGGLENISIPIMILNDAPFSLAKSFDPDFIQVKDLAITSQNEAWAVGRPGTIFHYNGNTWKKIEQFKKLPSLNSVYFTGPNNGIAVGYGGTILTYANNEWIRESSPVNVKLNGTAISGNTYYAVGNAGAVISMKYTSEIIPLINKDSSSPLKIESFPNPTSDVLNIIIPDEFGSDDALLSIIDASGKVIFLKNINYGTTGQIFQVNTSTFHSGLFLINIKGYDRMIASGSFIVKH